ncbi:hypothetical protein PAPYR_1544 [Paratrimastix pyriformis]|uniref:Endonuclease/exonuclease/phosphatase domain-containing protein n=1 Tax=Paratrimastix pyriformis TaxID=342808 RepID=A0ABQ8URV5_9EUKA|nr:hypothetical protein PAPYR_1544 [Paratrimastix pyriformis]
MITLRMVTIVGPTDAILLPTSSASTMPMLSECKSASPECARIFRLDSATPFPSMAVAGMVMAATSKTRSSSGQVVSNVKSRAPFGSPNRLTNRGPSLGTPRSPGSAAGRDRTNGRVFVFANTHFDYLSPEARTQSAKLVLGRLGDLGQAGGIPVVLTGDLNAEPDSEMY